MKRLTAPAYAEPENPESLHEEPLVVHQRAEPSANNKMVLFVHGLGGSRYGRTSTWGNFPRHLFEDIPAIDVGMLQYRTLTGRFGFSKSVSLEQEARVFADVLRDQLSAYQSIVLIGHSMGGLMCKAVIHELVRRGDKNESEGLPFLLNDAGQAFKERRVRIFKCPDTKSMLKEFSGYGEHLFRYADDNRSN